MRFFRRDNWAAGRWARRALPRPIKSRLRRALRQIAHPDLRSAGASPASGRPDGRQDYDLIVLPIIDWFFLFQRPQQLSLQFSRRGHRVFYVDQTSLRDGPWSIRGGGSAEAAWIEPGVALVSRMAPGSIDIYQDVLDEERAAALLASLDVLRRSCGIERAVCIAQLPFWTPLAVKLREKWGWPLVYDCMDEHAGFLTNAAGMVAQEEALIRESDLVLATSRHLYDKVRALRDDCLLVPNAADFDHFSPARWPLPVEGPVGRLRGPIIGYYGCISSWFDGDLVWRAARARPDWNFVLIGDAFNFESPGSRPDNVHMLGRKAYKELPHYLSRFDVCCIPFKIASLTVASNPVKFFEYLSAGKPVVSTHLPELEPFSDYVHFADGPDEFISAIEAALAERGPADTQRRVDLARGHTWRKRYEELDVELRTALAQDGESKRKASG